MIKSGFLCSSTSFLIQQYQEDIADYYHWNLQILPKLYKVAGFELGSGIYLNSASPEENAKYLKEITTEVLE